MLPNSEFKKIRGAEKNQIAGVNKKSLTLVRPDTIQTQLDNAHFISSFLAAVCTSLELEDICSIAARALYRHTPYNRIDFAFSEDFEGKTVTYSPMIQKKNLDARPIDAAYKSNSFSIQRGPALTSVRLDLRDSMGTIDIFFNEGQGKTLSESLLISVAANFSQAVRNALEHSKMKDLAMLDGLTKLYNRRIFDETLAQKARCQDKSPVSLLLIDLDNFKRVNDTFGHQSGDQVLKTVARILKESCRGHDLVARFGGEEFAIILSQAQSATAYTVAQRIVSCLAKYVFTFDGRQHQITASIGLATCLDGSTIFTSNLVKRADRALYHAKRTGKNRVCVFSADLLSEVPRFLGAPNVIPFISASC